MFETVRQILKAYDNGREVTPESNLMDDLAMGSIDIVDFVMDLEKKYQIRIPERKLVNLYTVQDYMNLIEELLKKKK